MRDFVKRPIADILCEFVTDLTDATTESGEIAWKGICPFHPDTNPSFHAYYNGNDELSNCRCWVCWPEGGDVIAFIIKYQKEIWKKNISFKEALALVADPLTPEQTLSREIDRMQEALPIPDLIDISAREYNLWQLLPLPVAQRVYYKIDQAISSNDLDLVNEILRRYHV